MQDDPKLVDLEPHKWSSSDEREKPNEPIFGDGWPIAASALGALVLATLVGGYLQWGPLWAGFAGIIGAAVGNAVSAAFQK